MRITRIHALRGNDCIHIYIHNDTEECVKTISNAERTKKLEKINYCFLAPFYYPHPSEATATTPQALLEYLYK